MVMGGGRRGSFDYRGKHGAGMETPFLRIVRTGAAAQGRKGNKGRVDSYYGGSDISAEDLMDKHAATESYLDIF